MRVQPVEQFPLREWLARGLSHDFFERGVVQHTLEEVLTCVASNGVVSIAALNERINKFPYHSRDTNRPQKLSMKSGRVKASETCSETWTLLRLLPLMLVDKLPEIELKPGLKRKWGVLTSLIRIV